LLNEDVREDFGKHLIPTQIQKGNTFAYLHPGYWEDIGTIDSYYQANLNFSQGAARYFWPWTQASLRSGQER